MDPTMKFHYNLIFPYRQLSPVGLKFALLDLCPTDRSPSSGAIALQHLRNGERRCFVILRKFPGL